ncbi:MAG: FliA/WhiG family RNA polymerase sigma factor [Lachnospiraceae bacterium]|jgi:RNA polymerase sigma factor for flagellar operon FliA|nr:FliA/WhiG family RNA polymerase sigma factor [Lachnospiraceae bacterium]
MDEAGKKRLWDDYCRLQSTELREKLILEYAPLVKLVAGRLSMYLGYNVEYEDLCSYGIFGLIDAIDKFDPRKGIKFETYASLRIRGAILDQIRKNDWIPRTIRQRQRQLEAAMRDIETEQGRPATDEELAAALGISDDELLDWQSQMKLTNVVSLNEFMESGSEVAGDSSMGAHFQSPEEVMGNTELKEMLMEALDLLTEKERSVILFYYYEELTLKEIAGILGVSESRISQLHTRALEKMRTRLGDYIGILHKI